MHSLIILTLNTYLNPNTVKYKKIIIS